MISRKVAGFADRVCRHSPILSQCFSSTSRTPLNIGGIYPPITTPFNADGSIDAEGLKGNMQKWGQLPFRGLVVQGSNGEYAYMTVGERVNLVSTIKSMLTRDKLLIAGSGCESTDATITMTTEMSKAGADAALVITPSFYKSGMNDTAMVSHFQQVADASDIPVILYSVPANTGIDLSVEAITELSSHPNIIGLKDSGGDISKLGLVVHTTQGNNFQVLAGSASFLLAAYHLGCVGGVCALANVLGPQCLELEALFKESKFNQAAELQRRLIAPNMDVTRRFGVPGLKTAMEWYGYVGGPCRSPLQPLTEAQVQTLRRDFIDNGFLKD